MPKVRLSFSPAPAHVRTARLVGVAVARRAGVAEELLEEVRLAIGEACSRAVALHRSRGVDDLVDVAMDDEERFTVRVVDRAGSGSAGNGPARIGATSIQAAAGAPVAAGAELLDEQDMAVRVGLTLLAGLVDDLEVASLAGGLGTEVCMSWPTDRRGADT